MSATDETNYHTDWWVSFFFSGYLVFPLSCTSRYCRRTWLWRRSCRRWSSSWARTKWSWRDSDRFGRFAASSDLLSGFVFVSWNIRKINVFISYKPEQEVWTTEKAFCCLVNRNVKTTITVCVLRSFSKMSNCDIWERNSLSLCCRVRRATLTDRPC